MRATLTAAIAISIFPAAAIRAADIDDIAECTKEREANQYAGIDNYAIVMDIMGHSVPQYFERVEVAGPAGGTVSTFVLVPPTEIQRRQNAGQDIPPEALDAYADGLRMLGDGLESEARQSGMPTGMMDSYGPAYGEEPWASPNPSVMMNSMADFVEFSADAKRREAQGTPVANDYEQVFRNAEVVGTESVAGRNAWHVRSDNLDVTQASDGQQFTIRKIDIWIDEDDCVPLRFHMEGEAVADGQTRDIFLERVESDYRTVPGTDMMLSYAQTMRMGGMLTPEEEAQMAEARQQMAEFEKQLAEMPPSQRAMMESMMGSQMEQMRSLVETGEFRMETRIREVRVNEGVEGLAELGGGMLGAMPAGSPPAAPGNVVQVVQQHLQTLGYNPGNTTGELDKMTVVAISRFQAENGMEVTGEATPQLAGILAARVDAQD